MRIGMESHQLCKSPWLSETLLASGGNRGFLWALGFGFCGFDTIRVKLAALIKALGHSAFVAAVAHIKRPFCWLRLFQRFVAVVQPLLRPISEYEPV